MEIKVTAEEGFLPVYHSQDAAGADLKACVSAPVTLAPGERAIVPTGVSLEIPSGYEGQVRPRSGLAHRHGVTMVNTPGTIDAGYRGQVKAIMINLGGEPFNVNRGDRIAQLVISPVTRARFIAANIRIGYTGADLGSSYFLPRLIGLSRAAEYMYTGRPLDASTAERIGFVSRAVPDDQLDQAVLELAQEMLLATPLALRATKELLNINIDAPSLMAATQLEGGGQLLCGMTEDAQEAIKAAYFEKRAPNYQDR